MDAAVGEGVPKRLWQTACGPWLGGAGDAGMAAPRRREDQHGMARRYPGVAQQCPRAVGQGARPLLPALAMPDMEHHARAIALAPVQLGALLQAQTPGGER